MIKIHTKKETKGFFSWAKYAQTQPPFKYWGGYFVQILKDNEWVSIYHRVNIKPNKPNAGISKRYGEVLAVSPIPNNLI